MLTVKSICFAGVPQKLTSAWMEYNRDSKNPIAVIITATECNNTTGVDSGDERMVRIISYPQGVVYTLPRDSDFSSFFKSSIMREVKSYISDEIDEIDQGKGDIEEDKNLERSLEGFKLSNHSTESSPSTIVIPPSISIGKIVPWKHLILVCVHASRDNRCGRAGPQIIEEFNIQIGLRSIPKGDIEVTGSSHIGGHKYAGVLVVYPKGDWYGLISKRNVGELLDNIINDTKYLKGWRGNESLSW